MAEAAESAVRFYFDFYCPYSYLAWEILQKEFHEKEFPLEVLAVGPNPPSQPDLLGRKLWSDVRWQALAEKGKALGLTIRPVAAEAFSLIPHQGMLFYEGIGRQEYLSGVFKGIFELGLDFGHSQTLLNHLQSEGIDTLPLTKALASPATLSQAKERLQLWDTEHIRVIPALVCGQDRLAGVLDRRGVQNFLNLHVR
ncbi:MAG: hypothetical protein OZSIB_0877 [Candidatus Ozemobacter sibiricus]|jgi:2-hydroxychromene-2-carboxylate isomerase|uniref:DSBA-like thioredoxin domain-containing protein n=1 Tax=Candidatus Ozemobacter sibiricus TaxID=2268124 RepID=A0A367ZUC0_9BACT|nr:MAG: hypothetical protein OZSIB_0877 [Candidatus Ozemobacter sibiricus]